MQCNVLLLHTIAVYNINLVLSLLLLVKELQWELVPWAHLSRLEIPHCHQEPFPRRANQITQWSFASAVFQWSEVVHTERVIFCQSIHRSVHRHCAAHQKQHAKNSNTSENATGLVT